MPTREQLEADLAKVRAAMLNPAAEIQISSDQRTRFRTPRELAEVKRMIEQELSSGSRVTVGRYKGLS